jgi:hypothetical protein
MKKLVSLIILLTMLLSLCSCGEYVSSYSALGLVKSQTSHSCEASFLSLNGKLVFKLKKSDAGKEGDISYSVQVEKGEINLYYDIYGSKQELAHVVAGENVTSRGGYIEGGKTVYIFIEATGGAKGRVSVELDN